MGTLQYGILYNIRKYINTGIMVMVMTLIFFCELIGLCLYAVSQQGKDQAFIYNGKALSVNDASVNGEVLEQIESIPHITSVDRYKWYDGVTPVGCHNVKQYEGTVKINMEQYNDAMCMVTHRNVQVDDWFRCEEAVSLKEGVFPTQENQGILVENRFAKENNLAVGDKLSFMVEEHSVEKKCNFTVCGIYEVDTSFVVNEQEGMEEDFFALSPYNRVYADCEYVMEQMGLDMFEDAYWNIYTDSYDSVQGVTEELRNLLGEDAEIYNNADGYLESSTAVVKIMSNLSKVILIYTSVIGAIVLLIVITFFHTQYRHEIGILIALGYGRMKIVFMYLWNMLVKIIMSLVLSFLLYCAASGTLVSVVDSKIIDAFTETINSGSGPYEIPNLEKGFSLTVDPYQILNKNTIIMLFILFLCFLFLCAAIPAFTVWRTKARTLLDD